MYAATYVCGVSFVRGDQHTHAAISTCTWRSACVPCGDQHVPCGDQHEAISTCMWRSACALWRSMWRSVCSLCMCWLAHTSAEHVHIAFHQQISKWLFSSGSSKSSTSSVEVHAFPSGLAGSPQRQSSSTVVRRRHLRWCFALQKPLPSPNGRRQPHSFMRSRPLSFVVFQLPCVLGSVHPSESRL